MKVCLLSLLLVVTCWGLDSLTVTYDNFEDSAIIEANEFDTNFTEITRHNNKFADSIDTKWIRFTDLTSGDTTLSYLATDSIVTSYLAVDTIRSSPYVDSMFIQHMNSNDTNGIRIELESNSHFTLGSRFGGGAGPGNQSKLLSVSGYAEGLVSCGIGGEDVRANGSHAIAIGSNVWVTGDYSMALLKNIQVTGDYSLGIQLGNATAEVLALDSTMCIMGGNVGIGTVAPATSAILDINSTTGALLLPRMTTTERNALTAVNGMIIYNTTTNQIEGYENGSWVDL